MHRCTIPNIPYCSNFSAALLSSATKRKDKKGINKTFLPYIKKWCEVHLTLGVPGVAAPSLGEGFLLQKNTITKLDCEFI